jgi:hypothetical protein
MKSAAIVISASITPAVFERCCSNRRKAVPYVTAEIKGDIELFPACALCYSLVFVENRRNRSFKPAGEGKVHCDLRRKLC